MSGWLYVAAVWGVLLFVLALLRRLGGGNHGPAAPPKSLEQELIEAEAATRRQGL